MKGTAWDALVAAYPEAKGMKRFDVDGFLAIQGLGRDRMIYTDPKTGLQWARNGNIASKQMNWNDANSWANKQNYGGYRDWRLPTKDELASFAKRGGNRPSAYFNANGFSGVQAGWYWSGTEYGGSSAWGVGMEDGVVNGYGKSSDVYVWPVRSGQF